MPKNKIIQAVSLSFWILTYSQFILSQNVKVIHIPDDVKIEENEARETLVHNLSEEEIYKTNHFYIIDGFIYIGIDKYGEIIKLNLNGKIICRAGRKGQGPGEFKWFGAIREFNGKIAVLDIGLRKVVIFNKNLDYISEFRLISQYANFFVDKYNRFIFFGRLSSNHYFSLFNGSGKFIKEFAKTITSREENMKILKFDSVRHTLYIQEEDGIWACFRNRYDLRYYKKEILSVEIKTKKGFFKGERQFLGGRDIILHSDRAMHISRNKDNLFYIYRIDKDLFCDIINLKDYRMLRRFKFNVNYRRVAHYKDNIFYAVVHDANEDEDLLLFKLEF